MQLGCALRCISASTAVRLPVCSLPACLAWSAALATCLLVRLARSAWRLEHSLACLVCASAPCPYCRACSQGHTDVVKLLCQHGVDVNLVGPFNRTALFAAVEFIRGRGSNEPSDLSAVEVLLQVGGKDSTPPPCCHQQRWVWGGGGTGGRATMRHWPAAGNGSHRSIIRVASGTKA